MGPAISFKARLTVCTEQSLLFIGYHMVNMDLIRVAKKNLGPVSPMGLRKVS